MHRHVRDKSLNDPDGNLRVSVNLCVYLNEAGEADVPRYPEESQKYEYLPGIPGFSPMRNAEWNCFLVRKILEISLGRISTAP